MSNRKYSVQPTMFINTMGAIGPSVTAPDTKLVEQLHALLDIITDENLALSIDYTIATLLRVHVRPDGMFEPELLEPKL